MNRIDHFTVGCTTLERGVAEMSRLLGVEVPRGSKHEAMSTHNCVMQAGNMSFFELMAIDPDAPDPGRSRWFSLDDPATRSRLEQRARALGWVVNTGNLDEIVRNSPVDLGEIVDFRRGDRTWRLTVPRDGSLPEAGLLPGFIEWSPGPHPSTGQQDLGVRLTRILLRHPEPDRLAEVLQALAIEHLAHLSEGPRALAFELTSPRGLVVVD